MRREYEMTDTDLEQLLDAGKPVPCMKIGSYVPRSPQENANDAWERLGNKMGFDHMTVEPMASRGDKFFTAIATGETNGS